MNNVAYPCDRSELLTLMKTALFLFLLFAVVSAARGAEKWTFHCEAEKGDMTASVPRLPTPLDAHILSLPDYSPDPLDRDAVIQHTTVRVVGTFRTHRIVEAHFQLKESFYTGFYLLLCETEPGRYLPIYAQHFHRGTRTPGLTSFSTTAERCSITVAVRYSGTGAHKTTDNITLTQDGSNGIQLRCDRND